MENQEGQEPVNEALSRRVGPCLRCIPRDRVPSIGALVEFETRCALCRVTPSRGPVPMLFTFFSYLLDQCGLFSRSLCL
ncbi:hypothetical protein AN958_03550 [Leucoagaricus sp. SymC.cos]|nr:hypothetical protein AN958_03550 [Leucoagaricus sp. SymC.cos]